MDEPTKSPTVPRTVVIAVAAVALVAVVVVLLVQRYLAGSAAPVPTPLPVATAAPTATPEPVDALAGVTLATSDPAVRDLVAALSSDARLAALLKNEDLVRRFVASVSMVAEGKSPRPQLEFMAPGAGMAVNFRKGEPFLDPQSYRRYDAMTAIFASLDPARTAALYRQMRPLVDAAWGEIGPPGKPFDTVLEAAIRVLLATPVLEGPVPLRQKIVTYAFADPDIEGLSDAQRQLLRLGPDNERAVQKQLRALGEALGIPAARLPVARTVHATATP